MQAGRGIEVTGTGFGPARLTGEQGRYMARVDFTGDTPPAKVKLSNVSDTPVSSKSITVTDGVDGRAVYDAGHDTLTVNATSTDKAGNPELSADGAGALKSSSGGSLTARCRVRN